MTGLRGRRTARRRLDVDLDHTAAVSPFRYVKIY